MTGFFFFKLMLSCPYIGHLKKIIKMVGDKINLNWLKKNRIHVQVNRIHGLMYTYMLLSKSEDRFANGFDQFYI